MHKLMGQNHWGLVSSRLLPRFYEARAPQSPNPHISVSTCNDTTSATGCIIFLRELPFAGVACLVPAVANTLSRLTPRGILLGIIRSAYNAFHAI